MIFSNYTDILAAYRENEMPAFAVFSGAKDILCRYSGDDLEEGAEHLENFLKRLESGSVKVKIYADPPKSRINSKTEPDLVLPYQRKYSAEEKDEHYQRSGVAGMIIGEIRQLKTELAEMKLAAVAADEEEDDEELADQMQPAPGGILGAILGNPSVQQIITNFLTNISANIVTPAVRPTALAGTGETMTSERKLALVDVLFEKGMTAADLEKLAAMPADRVAFLLQMLRANG